MANLDDAVASTVLKSLFVSLLIDLLGFTVILPLFPSLLEFYKFHDKGTLYSSMEDVVASFRKAIGVPENEDINSVLFGGMIGSLFSLLQFFNSPFFGAASDAYGRRPLIILSLCGSALSYVLWAMSDSFCVFLIARIVAGISEANVSISTAVIADLKSNSARSKGMAVIGVSFSVAFVIGPLIGAMFSKSADPGSKFFVAPAMFSLIITVIDIAYVAMKLPETLPIEKRAKSIVCSIKDVIHLLNPVSLFRFSAVLSTRQNPSRGSSLRQLGSVYFMYLFLFSGLEFTLTFLVHRKFGFTRMDQGKMFALLGLTMALVQGGYIRRKMQGKEKKLAVQGILLLIPGFIIVGVCETVTALYAGLLLFAFASASVVPCISSMTAAHGFESEKGRVMGILRSLGALARATGPICASAMYWLVGPTTTYIAGGLLLFMPLLCLLTLPVNMKPEEKSD